MNNPSRRMVELLSLLQTGRAWPAAELAQRLGTTPRTMRRDLDQLRELGYPVESTRGPGGSYRLVAGRAMPPLVLTDDEAVAVTVGLLALGDTAADSALHKLERLLPPRLRDRVTALSASTRTVSRALMDVTVLDTLATAAHTHHDLRFTYTNRAGEQSTRTAEPCQLVLLDQRWYLLAWDLDRDDWRTFRVDRIGSVEVQISRFVPRSPLPETMVHRTGEGVGVVRFEAPVAVVSPRLPAQAGALEATAAGCRYITPPDDWEWLATMVAAVGVPYEVVSPPELIAATEALAARATRATAHRQTT